MEAEIVALIQLGVMLVQAGDSPQQLPIQRVLMVVLQAIPNHSVHFMFQAGREVRAGMAELEAVEGVEVLVGARTDNLSYA
jgi:hypothetical protein